MSKPNSIMYVGLILDNQKKTMYPFCEVDHTATGGLQQHRTSERGSVESQLSEGRVKLHLSLGDGLNLLTESFEGSFQFLSQFSFSLFITYKSVT